MGDLKLLPERLTKKNRDLNVEVVATCLSITHCGNFVLIGYSSGHVDRFVACDLVNVLIFNSGVFRFNIQSGIWRGTYGKTQAHTCAVRGVATDNLNVLTISGGSKGTVKFWSFKNPGKFLLNLIN